MKIAQRFIAGNEALASGLSPGGTDEDLACFNRPSGTGFYSGNRNPAMNRWANVVRPYGAFVEDTGISRLDGQSVCVSGQQKENSDTLFAIFYIRQGTRAASAPRNLDACAKSNR